MPYINQERRKQIDDGALPMNSGELNYLLSKTCLKYLRIGGNNYKTMNDIVGALEGAKAEFYREVVVPFEEGKKIENGPLYSTPAPKPRNPLHSDNCCCRACELVRH